MTGADPFAVDRETEQELLRLARRQIRAWEGHREYPDMLAQAHLRAWQSYRRAIAQGVESPLGFAALGARTGPLSWLRRWYGREGKSGGFRQVVLLPLEEALALPSPSAEHLALARLEAAAVWERLMRRCTPAQQRALRVLLLEERTVAEAAAYLGVRPLSVRRIRDRALAWFQSGGEPATTFPRPLESYPRCPAGHPMIPSNMNAVFCQGKFRCFRCRRCVVLRGRADKARRAQQQAPAAAHPACGPKDESRQPPAKSAAGAAS